MFSSTGFPFSDSVPARPCHTSYHPQCIRVGVPFTTRRDKGAGLVFPDVRDWPHFICEACTVRSVLDRELHGARDWQLMCFERMRILDMVHSFSPGTHQQYQQKLRVARQFEGSFGVSILRSSCPTRPPSGPEIGLMWAQEQYSIKQSGRAHANPASATVAHGTVRQLRSAVSQSETWRLLISEPERLLLDGKRLLLQDCRFTDAAGSTIFATGMGARLGTDSTPSLALLDRHIRWLDQALDRRYRTCTTGAERRELARAGLASLLLYLGWLRSSETFTAPWAGFDVVDPCDAATVDLPENVGQVCLSLRAETKSARDHTADVVMAFQTLSGYCLGRWFHRLRRACGLGRDWRSNPFLIFIHGDGSPWTSLYFRRTYLYPALETQRLAGDPYLAAFNGGPGNSIPSKFWSLHCYRRAARTQVSLSSEGRHRKASTAQVYEHARWRRQRSGEKVDVMYRGWPFRERIKLTLVSM
jgi:hypothetical protein